MFFILHDVELSLFLMSWCSVYSLVCTTVWIAVEYLVGYGFLFRLFSFQSFCLTSVLSCSSTWLPFVVLNVNCGGRILHLVFLKNLFSWCWGWLAFIFWPSLCHICLFGPHSFFNYSWIQLAAIHFLQVRMDQSHRRCESQTASMARYMHWFICILLYLSTTRLT